jgi:hypothetical protein
MFLIKQIEFAYFDVKNSNRVTYFDSKREVDNFVTDSREAAKDAVLSILRQMGGVNKLAPKILSNSTRSMWIECDQPFAVSTQQDKTNVNPPRRKRRGFPRSSLPVAC